MQSRKARCAAAVSAALLGASACTTASLPEGPEIARFQSEYPEFGLTRGPDGWYLTRMEGLFGTGAPSRILRYPFDGGGPVKMDFPGSGSQSDFSYSPVTGEAFYVSESDIRALRWDEELGWQGGDLVGALNTPGYEASPQRAADGWLYYASMTDGGFGQGDIHRARLVGDEWQVELLGPDINSPTGEWNLAVSPDGKAMVFEASGRPTNLSLSGDLYLSCNVDGVWQKAVPMAGLNTAYSDLDFRFTGPREGVFTTAMIEGDGALRHAGPEHFQSCEEPVG